MIGKIVKILKRIFPELLYSNLKVVYKWLTTILKPLYKICFQLKLKKVQANHKKALEKVRKKEKFKVVFFLIHESVWKYEGIYKLMEIDERFEPIVIVCPFTKYGEETMLREMNQALNSFKNKGYNVIKTLKEDGTWLDVKKEIKPDILFFTNPWKLTKDIYYITEYMGTLTCYVPYFYQVTKHLKENFGGFLQNITWKVFYESDIHLKYAEKYSKNSAKNVVITGYPGIDKFIFSEKIDYDPWKIKDKRFKRVIWAPHHSILGQDSGLGFSNFIRYAYFFQQLVKKYISEIQVAFKPHPLLKSKLYNDTNWGINKTNKYYSFWEDCINGQLVLGEYLNLFLTSDAMIHDSGSFTIEYLATQKPTLYLLQSPPQLDSLNSLGKEAVDLHYKAKNKKDIENFLNNVVIEGNDLRKNERISFIKKNLVPPNNKTASQNIFNHILTLLN